MTDNFKQAMVHAVMAKLLNEPLTELTVAFDDPLDNSLYTALHESPRTKLAGLSSSVLAEIAQVRPHTATTAGTPSTTSSTSTRAKGGGRTKQATTATARPQAPPRKGDLTMRMDGCIPHD